MILFGCDDVGPAKYLAELIDCFSGSALCLPSRINRSIFEQTQARVIENLETLSGVELAIVGTSLESLNSSIDKQIIHWAKQQKVPSIAVIEHWSWYLKRFETSDGLLLPDFIIVNDEIAYEDAITEGLPPFLLKPLGNPYLERLSKTQQKCGDMQELREKYCLPSEKRIVVFISEELKSSLKRNSPDYLGYDEYIVLDAIQSVLLPTDHLVIKKHPEEDVKKYKDLLCDQVEIMESCPAYELAAVADVIVGMASMLLLELAMFRDDVISFRPGASKGFVGERLGATVPVANSRQLVQAMTVGYQGESSFKDRFVGSEERIIKFMDKIIL